MKNVNAELVRTTRNKSADLYTDDVAPNPHDIIHLEITAIKANKWLSPAEKEIAIRKLRSSLPVAF